MEALHSSRSESADLALAFSPCRQLASGRVSESTFCPRAEFLLTLLPGLQTASQDNPSLIGLSTFSVSLLNAALRLCRALEGFFCAKSMFPEQTSAGFPHFTFLTNQHALL